MLATNEAKGISWTDILAVVHRRRSLIVSTFLVTVAVVVAATLIMPKRYETRMKVLVKNERADMIDRRQLELPVNDN